MPASRGSIATFATYRPPVPVDIFSCPIAPTSPNDELHLTDGVSYNYNGQTIPPAALKALVNRKPELASACGATVADVDNGRATGLVFVSERENGLETLQVSLRFNGKVKVMSLSEIYGAGTFGGVRLEDKGCFAVSTTTGQGPNVDPAIIYVSTKERVEKKRTPWTVVYRTNLRTGATERLTTPNQYDLSPAVSPTGKLVAMATFRSKWTGEIEHLITDITVMNSGGGGRNRTVSDGGWPSWGRSDDIFFFHRGSDKKEADGKTTVTWGVFRYDLKNPGKGAERVTPENINAMTPAAIDDNRVAVATIRVRTNQMAGPREEPQYRHIEIFDVSNPGQPVRVTRVICPKADFYNPFVLDGGSRIGYHRARCDKIVKQPNGKSDVPRSFNKLESPNPDVGLFRVSGVFPTISSDGSKLAFVDNEFKAVWLADSKGLRVAYELDGPDKVFSTMWNQNATKDILYICVGPSFSADSKLEIYGLFNVSQANGSRLEVKRLTDGDFNNAFPSSNPEGTKIVFRSTRDHKNSKFRYKNLYIMQDASAGEVVDDDESVTRLTEGDWTDTHCQWSPRGNWIVFSSTREKPPATALELDNGLDLGHFTVYLVKADDPTVRVRVVASGDKANSFPGHVNHPVFSPDGRSIAFTADIAAVSAEPISMPMFLHSVRPYGDIFTIDIDPDDINKNKDDVGKPRPITRVTHSRYEYSTPAWTKFATNDPNAQWSMLITNDALTRNFQPACPYIHPDGGESWHMTGHLIVPKRCC